MSTEDQDIIEMGSLSRPSAFESELRYAQNLSHRRAGAAPTHRDKTSDLAMYLLETDPDSFPDGGIAAYSVLVGAFFGLIADFGIPNGMGAIEAYVSRHQLAAYRPSTVSWVFSLHLGTMYFGGVFFGGLFDRYGAKKLLVLGSACMFAGLIATAELRELYQFILAFGILTALGTSLAMVPLIGVMSHWFLRKRAMACSTATVGGLIGSSLFVVMLQHLYQLVGYKWSMRILAFICLACMAVAIVLVKERPRAEQTTDSIMEADPGPVAVCPREERSSLILKRQWRQLLLQGFSSLAPLRDIRFVSLTIAVFLAELNSMTILTYLTSFALAGGVAELKSYLLLTIVNVSGIPARLATGLLADKYGRFNVMLVTSMLSLVFVWALLTPSNGRLPYLYAFAVLYGVLSSAVLSLIAACLGQICPASQFGKHYGVLYFCLAFLIVLGMFFTSLVINTGSRHDYHMWIVFEGTVSVVCVLAWIWARWCNVEFRLCKY